MYSSVVGGGAGGDREELITSSQRQCEAWLSKTHDHQGGWGERRGGVVATAATGGG